MSAFWKSLYDCMTGSGGRKDKTIIHWFSVVDRHEKTCILSLAFYVFFIYNPFDFGNL